MSQAIVLSVKGDNETYRYAYEADDFFFVVSVNSQYPFNSPGRGHSSVAFKGDFNQGLEYWAKLMMQKDPNIEYIFTTTTNKPGVYYPRMWRGEMENLQAKDLAGSQSKLSKSLVAGELIVQRLFELFTFIEPMPQNQIVHSHKVRELLLLSCMEVESSWVSILKANGYDLGQRPSTNDYIKLSGPLMLANYEVEFPMYPEIGIIKPFNKWSVSQPTKSLVWYDGYNNTKHNREDNFHQASLVNAIDAVSAVAILLCAQFGPTAVPEGIEVRLRDIDELWPYIPLGNATRNLNAEGKTHGIGYNMASTWTAENFVF